MRSEMSASAVLLRLGYLEVGVVFPDLNIGTEKEKKMSVQNICIHIQITLHLSFPRDIPTIM
jgi:hypothetical protein